jgi:hypothetical protein
LKKRTQAAVLENQFSRGGNVPLMAIEKEPQKPPGIGWTIAALVIMVVIIIGGLVGLGWLVFYVADLICVAADPGSASALCQDVRN